MTSSSFIAESQLPGPRGPPSGAPYSSWERKGNPWVHFLMVILYARRRRSSSAWRPYSKKRNTALLYRVLLWYWPDIHTKINWHVSKQGIRWQYHRTISRAFTAHRSHMCLWSLPLTKSLFYDCQVNLFKTGQNWFEARLRIWNKPNYNFFAYTNVFAALFYVYGDFWNSKQKAEEKTWPSSYKTRIARLLFPGLA